MIKIAPSTLAEKEERLVEYVKELQKLNVDYVHCDVMDGKFVQNTCLSYDLLKEVRANTALPLDVHLMVKDPNSVLDKYCALRPTILTVHFEAFSNQGTLMSAIKKIRKSKALVGISIKPTTPVNRILHLLPYIDLVLVMGVEPGKSGQKMISNTCPKVKELRGFIYDSNLDVKIEVDGGVNEENLKNLALAGVDIVVMGKHFYEHTKKSQLIDKVHRQ